VCQFTEVIAGRGMSRFDFKETDIEPVFQEQGGFQTCAIAPEIWFSDILVIREIFECFRC